MQLALDKRVPRISVARLTLLFLYIRQIYHQECLCFLGSYSAEVGSERN